MSPQKRRLPLKLQLLKPPLPRLRPSGCACFVRHVGALLAVSPHPPSTTALQTREEALAATTRAQEEIAENAKVVQAQAQAGALCVVSWCCGILLLLGPLLTVFCASTIERAAQAAAQAAADKEVEVAKKQALEAVAEAQRRAAADAQQARQRAEDAIEAAKREAAAMVRQAQQEAAQAVSAVREEAESFKRHATMTAEEAKQAAEQAIRAAQQDAEVVKRHATMTAEEARQAASLATEAARGEVEQVKQTAASEVEAATAAAQAFKEQAAVVAKGLMNRLMLSANKEAVRWNCLSAVPVGACGCVSVCVALSPSFDCFWSFVAPDSWLPTSTPGDRLCGRLSARAKLCSA